MRRDLPLFKTLMKASALLIMSMLTLMSCASMKTQQDQYLESIPLARDGSYEQAALIIQEAKEDEYKKKERNH